MLLLCAFYNSIAAARRLSTVYRIEAHDPSIPDEFQGLVLLIILAVVNLWIGAYLGIILVGFDFYIRSRVLSARNLFDGAPAIAEVAEPPMDRLDLLRRLGVLRDGGVITGAEFEAEKLRLSPAVAA
jgi:hypothetical protein